ncbi:hypothetical protein BJ684DRAFT_15987 [Piptocephalis cylindrospora]|uniref:F-box domain-containing protein n=1 Tax=Piptocephalis cylindrospora TaxID=1907219 RepID=A0A4P9Y4N5_9FUNG|nr:hypothetical protein BJ684DRAFT_15987 [Piptocephalis cylindrospora]|eukprot:RKP13632.1 hypothetical protein BJ684DRAFT_15987 [Piptocephalis cylindrospora]
MVTAATTIQDAPNDSTYSRGTIKYIHKKSKSHVERPIRMDALQCLPMDITLRILGYLDYASLARARQVCRGWERLVTHPSALLPCLFALQGPASARSCLNQRRDGMWRELSRTVEREQRLDRGLPHSWMTLEDERREIWWRAQGGSSPAPQPRQFTTTKDCILTGMPGIGVEVWRWMKDEGGKGGRICWQGLCPTSLDLDRVRACTEGSRLAVIGDHGNLVIWDLASPESTYPDEEELHESCASRKRKRRQEKLTKSHSDVPRASADPHPFRKILEIPCDIAKGVEYPISLRETALLTLREKQYLTLWSIQDGGSKRIWSIKGSFDEHANALLIPLHMPASRSIRVSRGGGSYRPSLKHSIGQVLVHAQPNTVHIYQGLTGEALQVLRLGSTPHSLYHSHRDATLTHRRLSWYLGKEGEEVRIRGGQDNYTIHRDSSSEKAHWFQVPAEMIQPTGWAKMYPGHGSKERDVVFTSANDQLPGVLAIRRRHPPCVYEVMGPISHDILPDMDAPWCPMDLAPVLQGDHLIIRNIKSQILVFSFHPDKGLPTRV